MHIRLHLLLACWASMMSD
uniref:Uncharacterized protein n=1 Tax=Rhizophora mucronata TaxID=61149 RepID=A0A2P2NEH4_RHIMU